MEKELINLTNDELKRTRKIINKYIKPMKKEADVKKIFDFNSIM